MKLISKIFKNNWVVFTILALMVFGVYANILDNDFVWDDYVFIYNWDAIQKPFENLNELLFSLPERQTNLRPIKNAFYALNYGVFGENPSGYHLSAIVIHILNVWLVYLIAVNILKKKEPAFAASLIFGLHPVNVEAVAWVTASMDTLGHTFYLVSFWQYLRYRENKNIKYLWVSFVSALAAFLTNELTFSLVPTIVAYDILVERIDVRKHIAYVKNWLVYAGMIGGYFVFKFLLHGPSGVVGGSRIWVGIISLMKYMQILLWPVSLTTNHHVWGELNAFYNFDLPYVGNVVWPKITDPQTIAALIVICISIFVSIMVRKKNSVLSFLMFAFLFSFLPVMQIVPTTAIFAERYAYLAGLFFAMMIVVLVMKFELVVRNNKLFKKSSQIVVGCLFLTLITAYGFRTVTRNNDWQSAINLWQAADKVGNVSAMNQANLGKAYLDEKYMDKALIHLTNAVELNPNYPVALSNLGAVHNINESYEESNKYYLKAWTLDNHYKPAINGLAVSYLGMGEYEKARGIGAKLLGENPNNEFANLIMAKSFHKQFIFNQAENYYLKVLEMEPKNLDALNNLGNLYRQWGRIDEAKTTYEKVLEIDGEYGDVREKVEDIDRR